MLLEFSLLRVQMSENGNSENFEKNSFFEKNPEIFNFLIFRQNLGNNVVSWDFDHKNNIVAVLATQTTNVADRNFYGRARPNSSIWAKFQKNLNFLYTRGVHAPECTRTRVGRARSPFGCQQAFLLLYGMDLAF